MRHVPFTSRQERRNTRSSLAELAGRGDGGVYLYENNTSGDLMLPKKATNGRTYVPKGGQFQGDSYFMQLVRSNQLKLVKVVSPPPSPIKESTQETQVAEKKLILDQPDTVKADGKVEFVINKKTGHEVLKESGKSGKEPDVLLNEDPSGGVEILLG